MSAGQLAPLADRDDVLLEQLTEGAQGIQHLQAASLEHLYERGAAVNQGQQQLLAVAKPRLRGAGGGEHEDRDVPRVEEVLRGVECAAAVAHGHPVQKLVDRGPALVTDDGGQGRRWDGGSAAREGRVVRKEVVRRVHVASPSRANSSKTRAVRRTAEMRGSLAGVSLGPIEPARHS